MPTVQTTPLVLLALTTALTCMPSADASQKLLVVLLDGFRWDYVEKADLPNFKRLYDLGARADYLRMDFPTLSYPNYYTLMTGLHTETHGMTGNYMFDKSRREAFLIGSNKEQYNAHWWDGGQPLWVTAVKQEKTAYLFYWPGCEVTIQGTAPTFCERYQQPPTLDQFKNALSEGLQLLINGTTSLAAVYFEQPDIVGHKYGPDAPEVTRVLRSIDSVLGETLNSVETVRDKEVNLIVMSDHGMTSISPSRVINITDVLEGSGLYATIMEAGAVASIYTVSSDRTDKVYSLLKEFHPHMSVYKREDIPERLIYKMGKYVGDVTCIADLGWTILQPLAASFPQKEGQDMRGTHGYDNKEADMRGIFYALGPYFKAGSKVTYLQAVDLYNLMCDILDLNPAPNNGTRRNLEPLLAASTACLVTQTFLALPLAVFITVVIGKLRL